MNVKVRDSTDEIVVRARRIVEVLRAHADDESQVTFRDPDRPVPVGLHRRQICSRLDLTPAQYFAGCAYAREKGWIEVRGRGASSRVALVAVASVLASKERKI